MKKVFLLFAMTVLFLSVGWAQLPVRVSTDTLHCGVRQPNYYYSAWFDTTDWYLYGSAQDSIIVYNDGRDTFYASFDPSVIVWDRTGGSGAHVRTYQQYAPRPIRIKGLWAMVSQNVGGNPDDPNYISWTNVMDSARLPEYMYLYQLKDTTSNPDADGNLYLERIATVRWDTAHPKMMCLQKTLDPAFAYAKSYCHVYEALFDTVYTLEGEFWIGASNNSRDGYDMATNTYLHYPTTYVAFGRNPDRRRYGNPYAHQALSLGPDGPWGGITIAYRYGPFGVVSDGQRYVEVVSSDAAQGMGLYTAYYPDSTYQTITAVPNRGNRFSHWNDGVTDNPRTIFVTQDTVFTAYFDSLPLYHLEAQSNDEELGSVVGGAPYYEGEEAVLQAMPNEGNRFVCWNDSVTENPRSVVVTQDTAFSAYFEPIPQYDVNVQSNDEALGYVTGSNTYYEGDEAVIEAVAHVGNHFKMWNDSVTVNPRRIVVMQDTAFTAIFGSGPVGVQEAVPSNRLFKLMPNPASNEVNCKTAEGFGGGTLTVVDAAGREVLRKVLARDTESYTFNVADYPAGTYFVTLSTPEGTSTQRLVVE